MCDVLYVLRLSDILPLLRVQDIVSYSVIFKVFSRSISSTHIKLVLK